MNTRQLKKEQRRQEILLQGLELFITKGFKATQISDIAKRVEMSNGLFFHYYQNTEKLYLELVTIGLEATNNITKNTHMPAIDYFEGISKFLLKEINKSSFTAKMFVLMDQASRSLDTPSSVKEVVNQVNTSKKLVKVIERGQSEGSIKPGNPLTLANAFFSSLSGIAQFRVANKDLELPHPSWLVDIIRK